MEILQDRLEKIQALPLKNGGHSNTQAEFCVMEAVAYVAGEEWSDHPQCACPVIAAFLRSWNDNIKDDEVRTRLLRPLVPRLVGTRSTRDVEIRRSEMALDWLIRTHTVAFLRLVPSPSASADTLAALPEVTCDTAKAWDAAWNAASKSLATTVEALQLEAVKLVERMIEIGR